MSKPFTHRVVLDDRCVPTGDVERVPVEVDVLGDPTDGGLVFDDLFAQVPAGTTAWIEGGKHRITLSYDEGYPYAVLFAPPDQALVAIEPMTAPTDPLSGYFPIAVAAPGETYQPPMASTSRHPGICVSSGSPVDDFPTVGIVGGGQLARMAQQSAIALGVNLRVLAAAAGDSAAPVINDVPGGRSAMTPRRSWRSPMVSTP